jgi:hypothetical protein
MTQSDANLLSGVKFPDHQGKYREFLRFQSRFGSFEGGKSLGAPGLLWQIPYANEQGIIFAEQGVICSDQRILSAEQGDLTNYKSNDLTTDIG